MPIRTSSLNRQIRKLGTRLHLAAVSRTRSQGADQPPSENEQALREERRLLKEAQATRRAQAGLPKAKVVKPPKPAKPPKAPKAAKPPKAEKPAKDKSAGKDKKPSRADVLTKKAENAEAAKRADRKSAKT